MKEWSSFERPELEAYVVEDHGDCLTGLFGDHFVESQDVMEKTDQNLRESEAYQKDAPESDLLGSQRLRDAGPEGPAFVQIEADHPAQRATHQIDDQRLDIEPRRQEVVHAQIDDQVDRKAPESRVLLPRDFGTVPVSETALKAGKSRQDSPKKVQDLECRIN